MNILVISSNYPSRTFPNYGAFVYNLMQELANYNSITIIAPLMMLLGFYFGKEKEFSNKLKRKLS